MKLRIDFFVTLAFLLTWLLAVHEVNTHNPPSCDETKKVESVEIIK